MVCLVVVLFVNTFVSVHAQISASTAELEYLIPTQEKLINDLRLYINVEEKRLSYIKKYYNLFKRENEKAKRNISNYLNNPINAFRLIKSLTTDLNNIEHLIAKETELTSNEQNQDFVFPTLFDLKLAATGISRLTRMYHLNVRDLADGKIAGEVSSSPMTASDCYVLGRTLHKYNDFEMSISWMKEAYRKYNEDDYSYQFNDFSILEYISHGYYRQGDVSRGLKWLEKILNLEPENQKAKNAKSRFTKKLSERVKNAIMNNESCVAEDPTDGSYSTDNTDSAYEELCRGDVDLSIAILSRLNCRFVYGPHPHLKIAPIKMELKYLNPEVILYHDFLSEGEINFMKDIAKPKFQRAAVDTVYGRSVGELRISKVSWFYDYDFKVLRRISNRVSHVTGLSTKYKESENMQICNYGIGGHFIPHVDPLDVSNKTYLEGGRRIASVMFYLSDVPQGGATVFINIGLRIPPIKGAAVFWHNLHPSGEVNTATLHASCPVLVGSKWVCNKWFRQAGQEFIIPCNLQYEPEGHNWKSLAPPVLTISRDKRLFEEYKYT